MSVTLKLAAADASLLARAAQMLGEDIPALDAPDQAERMKEILLSKLMRSFRGNTGDLARLGQYIDTVVKAEAGR